MLDALRFTISAYDQTSKALDAVKANLGDVKGALRGVSDYADAAGRKMRNIGAGLSAAVTTPLAVFGAGAVREYLDAEEALTAVTAAVKSTGGAAGLSVQQLSQMAAGLEDMAAVDGDDIMRNVTAPLLTFTSVAGNEFADAQVAVLNISRALGTDLQSASLMVGKALNDPVQGVGALSKSGIQFSKDQKKMIAALVETGDVAGAQGIILAELNTQFGGQANDWAESAAGQYAMLGIAVGNVRESIGEEIVPFLTPVVDKVREAVKWFGDLSPEVKQNIVIFGGLAAAVGPVLTGLGLMTMGFGSLIRVFGVLGAAAMSNPFLAVIGLIAAGAFLIYQNWDGISAWFAEKWGYIKARGLEAWEGIKATWAGAKDWFAAKWDEINELAANAVTMALVAWSDIKALIGQKLTGLSEAFQEAWGKVVVTVKSWVNYFFDLGGRMIGALGRGISAALPGLLIDLDAVGKSVADAVGGNLGLSNPGGRVVIDPLYDAGTGVGTGMSSGVSDQLLNLYESGAAAGAAVEEGARDQLQTRSPSRVFMGIGRDITAGLSLGIAAGSPTAVAAMETAADALGLPADGLISQVLRLGETSDQVFARMGGWLVDLAKGATTLTGTIADALNSWSSSLAQAGMDGLSQNLTASMGGSLGGLAAGVLGGLMGFQDGGSFTVGGSGGKDSQLVAFMASPDEKVSITKPGQDGGSGGAGGQMDVRVFVDQNGNWQAAVERIAQAASGQMLRASAASAYQANRRG